MRAEAVVDLSAIKHNVELLKKTAGTKLLAVVKADAVELAKSLAPKPQMQIGFPPFALMSSMCCLTVEFIPTIVETVAPPMPLFIPLTLGLAFAMYLLNQDGVPLDPAVIESPTAITTRSDGIGE